MGSALILSVKRSTWRCHDERASEADADYQAARPRVLRRDSFTCRFCRFSVRPTRDADLAKWSLEYSGFLEVHHINDDHHDNRDENLVTVCPFCHQVFHAGNAIYRTGGRIIFCPFLTQEQINLTANLLAVAQVRDGRFEEAATRMWEDLQELSKQADQRYGSGFSNSVNLGTVLMGVAQRNPPLYQRRGELLAGIRLLPEPDTYSAAVEWWSDHAWLPEMQWDDILEQYLANTDGNNQ